MTAIRFPRTPRAADTEVFLERVYRYMTRVAAQEQYRRARDAEPLLDDEELRDWLNERVWDRVRAHVTDYQTSAAKGQWSGDDYERQLSNAAKFVNETHDPEFIRARAARGGSRSKRGASFQVAKFRMLDQSLSAAEQAKILGCSVRTVRRLRVELKTYDPALAGEFD